MDVSTPLRRESIPEENSMEMPGKIRRSSEQKIDSEVSSESSKRTRKGSRPVRLSLTTLQELQSSQGANRGPNNPANRRRRTVTESSALTDASADGSEARMRSVSLYGVTLSMRALRVTRRLSVGSGGKGSLERHPLAASSGDSNVRLENTYQMSPSDGEHFRPYSAQRAMAQLLEVRLRDRKYMASDSARLACSLADAIRSALRREIAPPRYKFICHVVIGEKRGQGLRSASRCLWDAENDNYACATFENSSLFAIATAFGVYYE